MGTTRFITAGYFIDGNSTETRRSVLLTVQNGIITAIGEAAGVPRDADAETDDLSHCTILPPLVDCSVALLRSPAVDERMRIPTTAADPAQLAAMLKRHVGYCHAHGVLGVANNDDPSGLVARYRAELAPEDIIEIRTSGRPDANGLTGGDFLRIAYSADIDDEAGPAAGLDQQELHRILRHRRSQKAVVVANGRQAVDEALAAGCDAIEQGYSMGEENLRKMAGQGVLWIPSLLRAKNGLDGASSGGSVCCRFSTRYVAPGKPMPGAEAFWKEMLAGQLDQLRLARQLGVQTAVGTGAGSVGILHGEAVVEEMKLFIKAGYSLAETIRCGSVMGADFFGMARLGALTVGRPATFLVTRGTEKQLPRKIAYLEGIYINGVPSRHYRKNPVKSE